MSKGVNKYNQNFSLLPLAHRRAWAGIYARMYKSCYDRTYPQYKTRGGIGIKMQKSWKIKRVGALNFYRDVVGAIGERSGENLLLTVRSADRDYTTDNMVWKTRANLRPMLVTPRIKTFQIVQFLLIGISHRRIASAFNVNKTTPHQAKERYKRLGHPALIEHKLKTQPKKTPDKSSKQVWQKRDKPKPLWVSSMAMLEDESGKSEQVRRTFSLKPDNITDKNNFVYDVAKTRPFNLIELLHYTEDEFIATQHDYVLASHLTPVKVVPIGKEDIDFVTEVSSKYHEFGFHLEIADNKGQGLTKVYVFEPEKNLRIKLAPKPKFDYDRMLELQMLSSMSFKSIASVNY